MSDRYKGAILSPTAPTVTPQSAGGIYTLSQQTQYQGQGVWPTAVNYPINNSLRFRSSASAYLSRTFSSGDQQKWTFSVWLKKALGRQTVFGRGSTQFGSMQFESNDTLSLNFASGGTTYFATTTQVFRDPSAWYHLVWAIDTTQATSTNRQRLYVNGTEVTAWSTYTTIPQNTNGNINTANSHWIGRFWESGFEFPFNGYMTEINFVNAVQLTPSSFGTIDAYGIWQPIPYTGAYGTNGFYLPFTDNSALTTSSNVGLGKDFSGNGNYWVTNNISITAGSTYDSMKDVPTNTNSNTANYAVLNPLHYNALGNAITNGNLNGASITSATSPFRRTYPSTIQVSSGKWYCELTVGSIGNGFELGIVSAFNTNGIRSTYYAYNFYDQVYDVSGSTVAYGVLATAGQVIGMAVDLNAGTIEWFVNNSSQGQKTGVASGNYFLHTDMGFNSPAQNGSINFGQQPFAYTPPSGFVALNTFNLPTPTILAGSQYFNAVTRNGFGSSGGSVTSLNFQPDFWWEKARNTVSNNTLIDSIRGVTKELYSNLTNAESTGSNFLVSFNSNGFTMGSNDWGTSTTLVDWVWKAGGSGGVSNTQGTITSTVSANTTAGFSIVTWTESASTYTVGHGLGVAPQFIILKDRSNAYNWDVGCNAIGWANRLKLNDTTATSAGYWNSTAPTSSVFTYIGNGTGNMVAYCFTPIAGYSAFGSYTGNGSADGSFVFLGFRPRYVMIKQSSSAGNGWIIYDTARSTYNAIVNTLRANTSDAEDTYSASDGYNLDILSNGFKLRTTWGGANGSGSTYIYMAFAENPFKIARGR